MKLNILDWLALVLMVIGSLNWGLVGAFDFNIVSAIFGPVCTITKSIFILVGLAGIYGLVMFIPRIIKIK